MKIEAGLDNRDTLRYHHFFPQLIYVFYLDNFIVIRLTETSGLKVERHNLFLIITQKYQNSSPDFGMRAFYTLKKEDFINLKSGICLVRPRVKIYHKSLTINFQIYVEVGM